MAGVCRIIGIRPPCQITWGGGSALLFLLQDLVEQLLGGIATATLGSTGPLAALLLHLLSHLHGLVQYGACHH